MTEDEFFAALEKTPRDWYLDFSGCIRRRHFGTDTYTASISCCPITAIDPDGPSWAHQYPRVAERLGISTQFRKAVVDSADMGHPCTSHASSTIRAQLLAACGLTERA